MSQDGSPSEDSNVEIIPVKILGNNVVGSLAQSQNPKKIDIQFFSEVYFPSISIIRPKTTDSESPKLNETVESTLTKTVENLETKPVQKHHIIKTVFSMLGTFLTAATATIAVVLVGVKVIGFKTFTVLSGSMEPEYPVGSMIYVKPTDYKTLKVGDVISYVANNDKTVVTHRIAEIVVDNNDPEVLRFKTKGDANSSADANLVHYKNVIGAPTVAIPYLGYFAHTIQQPPGIYIALVVGTLLLAWAFLPGTLEERRKTARENLV